VVLDFESDAKQTVLNLLQDHGSADAPALNQKAGFRNHRFAGQERWRQSAKSLHRPGVVPVTRANHGNERSGIDQDFAQDFPNLANVGDGWRNLSGAFDDAHTSLTKSKADTLGLFLRKVAASASARSETSNATLPGGCLQVRADLVWDLAGDRGHAFLIIRNCTSSNT